MKSKYFLMVGLSVLCLSCGQNEEELDTQKETSSSADLDSAAINAGILPDPENILLAGRFETRSDIGTDKFCAIKTSDNEYRIGILAVFGPESKCEGRGEAKLDGEKVIITLKNEKIDDDSCLFEADYDGISMQLPGNISASCSAFCTNRASLSGTKYFNVEQGNDAAKKSNGRKYKPLCRG